MPHRRLTDDQIQQALTRVFQDHGFEGATLSLIAQATGLQRASLYHRFPQGKEQMAQAVLDAVLRRFVDHVLAPLGEPDADPADAVRETARRLDAFYEGGQRSCVCDTMSLGTANPAVRLQVDQALGLWRDAFAGIARASGAGPTEARRRALEALAAIQGGLVLARGLGDPTAFRRALEALPRTLLGSP